MAWMKNPNYKSFPSPQVTHHFPAIDFPPGQAYGPGHHVLKKITQTWDSV